MDEKLFYSTNAWKSGGFILPAGIVERGAVRDADIIEEGKTKIIMLPHWMI